MSLFGKNAVITGGSSGIGFQTARDFLKEGVKGIVIVDINDKDGLEKVKALNDEFPGKKIFFKKTDVTEESQMKSAFEYAKECLNRIHIVLNAAGIYDATKWKQMVDINLVGVINGTINGFQTMALKNGGEGGVVLNLSSLAGLYPSYLNPIYCGTKFAVQGLSRGYGTKHYYDQTGVKIMTICPALVSTPMYADVSNNSGLLLDIEETRKIIPTLIPIRVESVSRTIIEAIVHDDNGSVWTVIKNMGRKEEMPEMPDY